MPDSWDAPSSTPYRRCTRTAITRNELDESRGDCDHSYTVAVTEPRVSNVSASEGNDSAGKSLTTNFVAVVGAGVVTGVLGLFFWAVAGRLYPAEKVGAASALINTAVMLATLSSSSVGALYERFLPLAYSQTRNFIRLGQLVVAIFAAAAALLIIAVGPTAKLLVNNVEVVAFVAFCVVTTTFALQDHIVTGLTVARWGAYKNVFHSVTKLVLLVCAASLSSAWAIIGAWWIPALMGLFVLAAVVRRRITRSVDLRRVSELPSAREMWSYFGGSVGILAVGTAVPLVVPLLVVARFGVADNAYFAVAWSMVSAAVIVLHMLIGPFVAEAASGNYDQQLALLKRFSVLLGGVAFVGAAGLALVGPFILGLVGEQYRSNGAVLLYFAAAVLPLTCTTIIYQAFARATKRLRFAVAVQVLNAVIILGGISLTAGSGSLADVGRWFLIGELVCAVLCLVALAAGVRRQRRVARVIDRTFSPKH